MRKAMWLPMVLVLVPGVATAQGRMGMGRMQGQRVAPRMLGQGAMQEGGPAQRLLDRKDALNLTDEQVSRLEALAKDWTAAHEPIRAQMEQMREARQQLSAEQRQEMLQLREQAQAAGENARQEIESLLTEDQLQTLRSRQGRMMGGRGGAGLGVGRRGMIGRQRGIGVGPRGGVVAPRAGLGLGPQGLGRPLGRAQRLQLQRRLAFPPAAGLQMRRRMIQRDTIR